MDIHIFNKSSMRKLSFSHTKIFTKKIYALLFVSCIMILSGCSADDFFLHRSGIEESDYQKYIELRDEDQLDEEGLYISQELDGPQEFAPPADSVHVTFAENTFINVQYFLDAEGKIPVNLQQCYLKPGECIYASEPECYHPITNCYSFDRFCVYSVDMESGKREELFWTNDEAAPLLVLQVPDNYGGAEVSVVPIGKYKKRQLELLDYYTDSTGNHQELYNEWTINDETTTGRTIDVSPVEPLAVDYRYDSEKYCYVSSNPSSFYHEKGLVRFELVDAAANIERYSVELRPIDNEAFLFDPSQYTMEHGTVSFEYAGRPITEPTYVHDGDDIQYTATPEEGYRHPRESGKITANTSDPTETDNEIREVLKFYPDEDVRVILPRPIGGTIEYRANGELLSGEQCTLPIGTIITMKFLNWNGWKNEVLDGAEYVVQEPNQEGICTVSIKNVDINNDAFTEDSKHKPTLDIVLTDSARDVKIDVLAAGVEPQKGRSYADGSKTTFIPDFLGQNDRIVFSDHVGTYPAITLRAKEDTVYAGHALKLEISKEDTFGNKTKEIRYIKKLPCEEKIELYDEEEIAKSSITYKNVGVKISMAEVVPYSTRSVEHAEVIATFADTDSSDPNTLQDGDLLEAARNVEISIVPETGYYVEGAKNMDGTYHETLKFSKWEKEYQKILDKHPVMKIWYVTLNSSDSYGTCSYKLDGKEVSGSIGVHEGQKLTLEYELTDSNYQIVRSGIGGIVGNFVQEKTKTCTIPITEALNGQTIQRSDYIEVRRKE